MFSPPSVCPSVRLSVSLLCYLLLNHWTKFNQIWCMSYLHKWGAQRRFVFGPAPWGPGEGSKGQISFNFNYKVNIFIPNFVCVLTNESYKTYQTGFLFCRLRHALGWDLGILRGQNQIPSCCLSVMLSPPKPLDEIKPNFVCELLICMGRATSKFFGPRTLGPWGGVKRSNII